MFKKSRVVLTSPLKKFPLFIKTNKKCFSFSFESCQKEINLFGSRLSFLSEIK